MRLTSDVAEGVIVIMEMRGSEVGNSIAVHYTIPPHAETEAALAALGRCGTLETK